MGSAPGKLLLVGEHAVVHGGVAFALPFPAVQARAEVLRAPGPLRLESPYWSGELSEATPAPARGLALAALATLTELGVPARDLVIRMEASIPLGAGLGSSAATAAALVRALMAAHGHAPGPEVEGLVHLAEIEAHGKPSGVDGQVVTLGRPIAFQKGQATAIVPTGGTFHLVVADSGVSRNTRVAVANVAAALESDPAAGRAALGRLKQAALDAMAAWEGGDVRALGGCLDRAQADLAALGVSTPGLERLLAAARAAGALGAKLTGAGQGGCVLALAADEAAAVRIAEAMRTAGARAVWTQEYRP
jgi:mevalonate kinase